LLILFVLSTGRNNRQTASSKDFIFCGVNKQIGRRHSRLPIFCAMGGWKRSDVVIDCQVWSGVVFVQKREVKPADLPISPPTINDYF
jgi:hypothetical protein